MRRLPPAAIEHKRQMALKKAEEAKSLHSSPVKVTENNSELSSPTTPTPVSYSPPTQQLNVSPVNTSSNSTNLSLKIGELETLLNNKTREIHQLEQTNIILNKELVEVKEINQSLLSKEEILSNELTNNNSIIELLKAEIVELKQDKIDLREEKNRLSIENENLRVSYIEKTEQILNQEKEIVILQEKLESLNLFTGNYSLNSSMAKIEEHKEDIERSFHIKELNTISSIEVSNIKEEIVEHSSIVENIELSGQDFQEDDSFELV